MSAERLDLYNLKTEFSAGCNHQSEICLDAARFYFSAGIHTFLVPMDELNSMGKELIDGYAYIFSLDLLKNHKRTITSVVFPL